MRKKIVAGNWKMNKTLQDATILLSEVVHMIKDEVVSDVQVVLCPPFPYLNTFSRLIDSPRIALGAQNCHPMPSGAFTGEVSAPILASIGVDYVLVGHSERRQYFNESSQFLAEKVDAVLSENMIPIFCCGESLEQREKGDYVGFVCQQITESLYHLVPERFSKIVIAYEPIWAIGTGLTASSQQAQDMHASIRKHIAYKYGKAIANSTSILYGGSCNEKNAAELFACPDVDGGLIGGASLKSREFTNIVKAR